ncbi:MAG: DUF3185 family protein [Nibricoccus sp.]
MSKIFPILLLVAGVILLAYGLNSSDSLGSQVSETVGGTLTDQSIFWLIVGGVAGLVAGGLGLMLRRQP